MYFERFDICEAYYLYAMDYHRGAASPEYAIFGRLSRIGFKPSPLLSGRAKLTDNGQEIYDALVSGATKVRLVA